MTTTDEDWVPTEEEVRHFTRAWLTESDMDRFLARVRRDAEREAYTTARSVLAGEDTVEWARGAHGSSMSYPHAIGIMDDLIKDLDEEVSP